MSQGKFEKKVLRKCANIQTLPQVFGNCKECCKASLANAQRRNSADKTNKHEITIIKIAKQKL